MKEAIMKDEIREAKKMVETLRVLIEGAEKREVKEIEVRGATIQYYPDNEDGFGIGGLSFNADDIYAIVDFFTDNDKGLLDRLEEL
jgi:hypothetical protein